MTDTRSNPLVSIVTPVYNEAEHLPECIESVMAQTYQNWEYTILDNCSTDGTGEIAHRYAQKDRRIRVLRNETVLPPIPNHNAALRQISNESKYCKVVFGDDWMFPECLSQMVAVAEEHPSVGIVGAYRLEGRQIGCTGLPYPSRVVFGRRICRDHFLRRLYVFGSPTNVLYRSDVIRGQDPFYNETNIHADTEACIALLRNCDFGFVHQVLSFSRLRPQSLRTLSSNIASDLPGSLRLLVVYGRDYLTSEELKGCLERCISEYYRTLGKSLILGYPKSFWAFHKRSLIDAGVGFSLTRLARGTLAELFDALFNPANSVRKLRRRLGDQETIAVEPVLSEIGKG